MEKPECTGGWQVWEMPQPENAAAQQADCSTETIKQHLGNRSQSTESSESAQPVQVLPSKRGLDME